MAQILTLQKKKLSKSDPIKKFVQPMPNREPDEDEMGSPDEDGVGNAWCSNCQAVYPRSVLGLVYACICPSGNE